MFYLLLPGFSMLDAVGACIFAYSPVRYFDFRDLVGIVDAITGWETCLFELFKAGERRIAMFRVFNSREGFTIDNDTLPERYFQPIEKGPKEGMKLEKKAFEDAKYLYYRMAGLDTRSGRPTNEKLLELGIERFGTK
jgi:aldehyde:ferredoxin oxidoreductase